MMIIQSGLFFSWSSLETKLTRSSSVYYEMPQSSYVHKSMLLRGVKFPKPALNPGDIEATKARAAGRGGRGGGNYGGPPSRHNSQSGNARESYKYAPHSNMYPRQSFQDQRPQMEQYHNSGNHYSGGSYSNQLARTNWQPPPPGISSLATGPPPPGFGSFAPYPPPPQAGPPHTYGAAPPAFGYYGANIYPTQGGAGNKK